MNISSINNSRPNFNGKIITKGPWTKELKDAFLQNEEIKKVAAGKYNIIGHLSKKKADFTDFGHSKGETVYKLQIEAMSESPSLLERAKSLLGFTNVAELSNNYHSEIGTEQLMYNRLKADAIAKCLDINL